ncbi:uncharacterized protein LOC142775297 [Rhipicephalus microplus]|uniref:uncharacterized protein LOC142775297 n=1 Tax=Rhipicephalus microplus TaxID=6941 RepID=UPI003F6B9B1C
MCKGRLAVRRLKYVVFGTWTLVAFFAVNYAFMRVCVSDMGWHVEQRDVIPRMVGTRGFPMLPRVAYPRYLAVVVYSATELRYASRPAGSDARPFLAGYVVQGRKTVRRAGSKWYMPLAVYEPDWLPSYIHSSGYVVSRDAVRPLFAEALATSFLYVEDIFLTGVVAQKVRSAMLHSYKVVGIELTNWRCFIPYWVWHPCDYRNFSSTHEWDLKQLLIAWQSVHYADDICPPANESLLPCSYARVPRKNTFLEPWQCDQTHIVVGPGRFRALPQLRYQDFLAIVCSAVDHLKQRAVVRDTWARNAASRRSGVFFLSGFADSTPSGVTVQQRVANDIARYGDIIQADFRNTYRHLTLKSVFLLKPFQISNMRRKRSAKRSLGHKNYLPLSVFSKDDLLLYGSGTAYVMSPDAVRPMFTEALLIPFLHVEDIFITGFVAEKVGDQVVTEL